MAQSNENEGPSADRQSDAPSGRKIKEAIENNIVWFSLSLAVVVAVSSTSLFLFLEERVDKQIKNTVPGEVKNDFYDLAWTKERQTAESAARDALFDAQRSQHETQKAYADAQVIAADAARLANELREKVALINGLIDIAKVNERIDTIVSDPRFRAEVISRVLPNGAVVAFDKSEGCPSGWSSFLAAGGRTIIGAGPNSNLDENGRQLSVRQLGASGGEEKHKLSLDEMPPHNHGGGLVGTSDHGGLDNSARGVANNEKPLELEGKGLAHNIMPPFIALYYCKKG
jgi:hypothetical protein